MGKRERKPELLEIKHERLAQHLVAAATRYRNIVTYLRRQGHGAIENLAEKCRVYEQDADECEHWALLLAPAKTRERIAQRDAWHNRRHWR